VRALSGLFRRLVLEQLTAAYAAGQLAFFGDHASLADSQAFASQLAPVRTCELVVYAKRPFARPEAVLANLARYTHRVAITCSRLLRFDETELAFRWKDYGLEGWTRRKMMTLPQAGFIRRFLLHALPASFHRIRHYGFFANLRARRKRRSRACPDRQDRAAYPPREDTVEPPLARSPPCPQCGVMAIIKTLQPGAQPRAPPYNITDVA
jgi:hypothetical protein